ncbi:hypothetical protein HNP49_003436 [Pseudomonas fluvialis]|uniref:Uncharacterized protein n=1 Tax=Pseudomonas fluvialis TaxID=1793966 RepID=A0A7X0BVC1_9PSED|nr:hypothetical protein [Pseudomonas fluvialis]MBB6343238.1 hypothetical protein [Pseudomonas fluvialis]
MHVKPVGELVFEMGGNEHQISVSQLSQGDLKKQSGLKNKDDSEEWSVTFTADSEFGQFVWVVSFGLGNQGLSVDDSEMVKRPAGVEVIQDVSFKSA